MKGTIKEKLTLVVILIVVAAMVISSAVIVGTSGSKLTGQLTSQLQINADKYANSINSWIEMEKGLNSAGAAALAALPDKSYNVEHAQQMVTTQAAGHPELLNLYYGMADKTHLHHLLYTYSASHSLTSVGEIFLNLFICLFFAITYWFHWSLDVQLYVVIAASILLVWGTYFFLNRNIFLS